MKQYGSRAEVYRGQARMTRNGYTKKDIYMRNGTLHTRTRASKASRGAGLAPSGGDFGSDFVRGFNMVTRPVGQIAKAAAPVVSMIPHPYAQIAAPGLSTIGALFGGSIIDGFEKVIRQSAPHVMNVLSSKEARNIASEAVKLAKSQGLIPKNLPIEEAAKLGQAILFGRGLVPSGGKYGGAVIQGPLGGSTFSQPKPFVRQPASRRQVSGKSVAGRIPGL